MSDMSNNDHVSINPFLNSDFAADHSLALPIYPELSNEQIEFVVEKITEFIRNR